MRFWTAFDSGVVAPKLDILNGWDCARGVEVTVGGMLRVLCRPFI